MKLSLTLSAILGISGTLYAQRPNIVRPTFPRPAHSLGSFLPKNVPSVEDEQEPTEIGTPEPSATSGLAAPGAADSDIESKPVGKLTATPTGTAKPLQPEKLVPSIAMNLALVVGLMVVGAFAWKTMKRGPRRSKGSAIESESGLPTRLEIEDQLRLATGQTLYSIRHGGRAFLIGSTPQTVTLLADLNAPSVARPALSVAPAVAAPAEPRRPKPASEAPVAATKAPEANEDSAERFNGILDRLRAQESAGAIASALTEPIAEPPAAPARRRSLFDGGSR